MSRKKSKSKSRSGSGNKKPLSARKTSAPKASGPKNQPRRGGLPVDNAPPNIDQMKQINFNAAGIDIASGIHFVAVPEGRDPENHVRSFGAFTADLNGIADWLTECRITSVAMESTGVYWIPLYELLERRGFEVMLVEPSQIKKFRRKTDVLDSQWIQTLHSFGLLTGSFRPTDEIIVLRNYMRQREMLVKQSSRHVQHMQKAMEQMNLKLTEVISDICGVTGMSIIDAILSGQRDPHELAKLRHDRCSNDEATIALALHGNWREDHLFSLEQAVDLYRYYHQKIAEVDERIEAYMLTLQDKSDGQTLEKKPRSRQRSKRTNEPKFDTREMLYRLIGIDLTVVDGIAEHSALQLISEIGIEMSAWPTENHFTSWLSLCPEQHKSGGRKQKKGKSRTHRSNNRAAQILRVCAQTLINSKCALGAFARRIKARDGAASAVTAVARKLAIIVYTMIKTGRPYVDHGAEAYDARYRERIVNNLRRRAEQMGFGLSPNTAA
ncbi:Transposase [Rubripirellula obstinata]|uniref:Transposase n=1 Tax=Rubripirellula obstinata TaxID=406547 RepID=A0A5B1C8I8_9BACT|nr:IS110 family transposase [Rubripirellula obstinata]KAA1257037.1 Transposase [Rubripirellula obstinata]KAA1257151.1 Transposase [Rubripirellula obstinata]KAA1257417.1 Transposase [Rubripirellula obstinata]KAA1262616.1 Transposase [Rubripirellula obstinata]